MLKLEGLIDEVDVPPFELVNEMLVSETVLDEEEIVVVDEIVDAVVAVGTCIDVVVLSRALVVSGPPDEVLVLAVDVIGDIVVPDSGLMLPVEVVVLLVLVEGGTVVLVAGELSSVLLVDVTCNVAMLDPDEKFSVEVVALLVCAIEMVVALVSG